MPTSCLKYSDSDKRSEFYPTHYEGGYNGDVLARQEEESKAYKRSNSFPQFHLFDGMQPS